VTLRRNAYLRGYVSHFIGLLAPELTPEKLGGEMRRKPGASETGREDFRRETKT